MLESAISEMRSMLSQISARTGLDEYQQRRLAVFTALTDRYAAALVPLTKWVAAANLIHQGKANIDESAYEQVRFLIGKDFDSDQETSTSVYMAELSQAIQELHAKPESKARSAGLAIMTSAYNIFYQIHFYFYNEYPRVQKSIEK